MAGTPSCLHPHREAPQHGLGMKGIVHLEEEISGGRQGTKGLENSEPKQASFSQVLCACCLWNLEGTCSAEA